MKGLVNVLVVALTVALLLFVIYWNVSRHDPGRDYLYEEHQYDRIPTP